MLILATSTWVVTTLGSLFGIISVLLMLVILIQKPRGGGLSGAFGGAGGSAQAAFGAKTGDVLTWFTVICFAVFLLLAMGLTWTIGSHPTQAPAKVAQPATPEAPTPGPATPPLTLPPAPAAPPATQPGK